MKCSETALFNRHQSPPRAAAAPRGRGALAAPPHLPAPPALRRGGAPSASPLVRFLVLLALFDPPFSLALGARVGADAILAPLRVVFSSPSRDVGSPALAAVVVVDPSVRAHSASLPISVRPAPRCISMIGVSSLAACPGGGRAARFSVLSAAARRALRLLALRAALSAVSSRVGPRRALRVASRCMALRPSADRTARPKDNNFQ